ncbi:MAG: right-handed parallel beta-helix repeat-containing protein, partial [Bacteroidales bacterium]|nr:right-handed parallel beta-helix repeat-containing protein [Bacteroidales bacterium]
MSIYIKQGVLLILILQQLNLNAKVLHVGADREYSSLTQAVSAILPGDTVLVYEGIYPGGFFAENLKGTESAPISVFASGEVIFQGGSTAWQLSDAAFVHIRGFIFQKQSANGVNFDDGGSYQTPSHHIIVEDCTFRDIQATGNNDLLKMSGVDDFEIRNCRFLNGSPGGSGIDMVGCHNGIISNCHFENQGSNSIQAKGGTSDIRIGANLFNNGGQRTLNLGGSTGLSYFRPVDARFEAARLKVYSNVIIGSQAAVAFVGCIDCEVINNTIYLPDKWVLRILQETVDITRFAPCGQNIFRNNIVVRDNRVSTDCNIGGNTDPQSFIFSNNLWYNPQNNNWPGPSLPVKEENISVGKNPLFVDENAGDFSLQNGSPAIANGYNAEQPVFDFNGIPFATPRSTGAFEKTKVTGFQ